MNELGQDSANGKDQEPALRPLLPHSSVSFNSGVSTASTSPPPHLLLQRQEHHKHPPRARRLGWNPDEEDILKHLLELDIKWPERLRRLRERFGALHLMHSLKMEAKYMQKDCPSCLDQKQQSWTQDEDKLLRGLIETEESWNCVVQNFGERSKTNRSLMAMQHSV